MESPFMDGYEDYCEQQNNKAMSEAQNIFPKREPEHCPNCRYLKFFCKCASLITGSVQNNPVFTNHEQSLKVNDMVNHPAHYASGAIECIDAIAEATKDLQGIEAVCTANALKYLWRWKKKNGKQDIEKAQWYLQRLMDELNKAK